MARRQAEIVRTHRPQVYHRPPPPPPDLEGAYREFWAAYATDEPDPPKRSAVTIRVYRVHREQDDPNEP